VRCAPAASMPVEDGPRLCLRSGTCPSMEPTACAPVAGRPHLSHTGMMILPILGA
jgi:hypothetical protein